MRWYHESIKNKLLTIMTSLLLALSAAALWGFWSMWTSTVSLDLINRSLGEQERSMLLMTVTFKGQVQEWKDVLLRGKDPAALDRYWGAFEKKEREIESLGAILLAQVKNEKSQRLIHDFLAAHKSMGENYRTGLKAFKDAGMESKAGDAAVKGIDRAPIEFLEQAARAVSENIDASMGAALEHAKQTTLISLLVFSLVAAALLVSIVLFIERSVARPSRQALRVTEALAKGDLCQRIEGESRDEMGRLLKALRTMVERLTEMLHGIQQNAATINVASAEIASGNADLSQRTEEQAASLEETASSMDELTSTVRQNAENARQANQLAIDASEVAVKGGKVVNEVVGTMFSINESSRKIGDIIGVIDGIAFQTNILALNAAVEAARAGEQGRGFAVVATEVRNLAQRSAAAAKEIKALIGDSVEKVDAGTKLVDAAGKTMEEIVASVKRVTDIMGEITAATQEQSTGIEQVNKAVMQMDEVTQQNAALVEQAAAAAESLKVQAQNLESAVSVFKLSESTDGSTTGRVEETSFVSPSPARKREAKRVLSVVASAKGAATAAPAGSPLKAVGSGEDQWEAF